MTESTLHARTSERAWRGHSPPSCWSMHAAKELLHAAKELLHAAKELLQYARQLGGVQFRNNDRKI